ncbi:MAG TPA: response regulator transcription factor [Nocardiopsis listeri]|uniref:response regulator transcription factor n=1 Tax=Nocardiopsis listeri TaxID=53440 RepID=UPI001D3971DB|nr:response regulator transcription factor [Nocardiopsis listeri]HJE59107.1 response regulator transcription factor [Nocardiopsis listeri]
MRIVIAEDDTLLREGLAALLRGEGFEIAATVGDPDALIDAVTEKAPDLAIVDVRMPPTHTDEGVRAAIRIREIHPGMPVLVLSAYIEQSFASDLMAVSASGVGYLLKERVGRVDRFLEALRRVAKGQTVIDPEVVTQLFAHQNADEALGRLSPRERDVLALMAEGLGNAAIAEQLFVTDGAVHKHIRSIFGKLGLSPDDRSDRRVAAVLRYLDSERA